MRGNWQADAPDDGLMSTREVAAILRVTPRQVARMTAKGRLRVAAATSRGSRYRIDDVIEMACREADDQ